MPDIEQKIKPSCMPSSDPFLKLAVIGDPCEIKVIFALKGYRVIDNQIDELYLYFVPSRCGIGFPVYAISPKTCFDAFSLDTDPRLRYLITQAMETKAFDTPLIRYLVILDRGGEKYYGTFAVALDQLRNLVV